MTARRFRTLAILAITAGALVAAPVAAQASPRSASPLKVLTKGKVSSLIGQPIQSVDRTPNFAVGQYYLTGAPSYSPPGFNCDPATVITGAKASKRATYLAPSVGGAFDVRVLLNAYRFGTKVGASKAVVAVGEWAVGCGISSELTAFGPSAGLNTDSTRTAGAVTLKRASTVTAFKLVNTESTSTQNKNIVYTVVASRKKKMVSASYYLRTTTNAAADDAAGLSMAKKIAKAALNRA